MAAEYRTIEQRPYLRLRVRNESSTHSKSIPLPPSLPLQTGFECLTIYFLIFLPRENRRFFQRR